MANEIKQLGKGVLLDPPDDRDYPLIFQLGAPEPIDWSQMYKLPEPPDANQRSSDACVAYSTSYLHWQFKRKDYSRRDVFSRIFLDYGAYLRDGVKQICTTGQQTQDECPDPPLPTKQNMRIKSQLSDAAGIDDLEANYFVVTHNSIDAIAQAVRDFQGCIFGVYGTDAGWSNLDNPTPPASLNDPNIWGHAIYAYGYHMHDGQKCIIAKSSWCTSTHDSHHIKENYFNGFTMNAWCVIPKEDQFMTNSLLLKRQITGADGISYYEYGFYDPETTGDGLISDMRNRGIKPPLKPDGTLDWALVEGLVGGQIVSN